MQKLKILACVFGLFTMFTTCFVYAEESIAIRDGAVSISEAEMAAMIDSWTDNMREAAARDKGERFEMISAAVMSRKMANEAKSVTPEDPGFWEMQFKILNIRQRFVYNQFMKQIEVPDLEDLAQERYQTEKDKYAKVPEHRKASHILLRCMAGKCNREELRPQAEELLAKLRDGADFEAMVAAHSEDPGSKSRGGSLTDWIRMGDPKLIPEFVGGLFEIEEIGGFSTVTESRFGLHIIRLDDIAPAFYQPYERVRDAIVKDLENEYKKLAGSVFQAGYQISEDAYINGDVMDRLFAPYNTEDEESADSSELKLSPNTARDEADETEKVMNQ